MLEASGTSNLVPLEQQEQSTLPFVSRKHLVSFDRPTRESISALAQNVFCLLLSMYVIRFS